jgi:hypothetical protein
LLTCTYTFNFALVLGQDQQQIPCPSAMQNVTKPISAIVKRCPYNFQFIRKRRVLKKRARTPGAGPLTKPKNPNLLSNSRCGRCFHYFLPLPPSRYQVIIVLNQPVYKSYGGAIGCCAFLNNKMGIHQIPEGVPGFIGCCPFVFDIFRGCRAGFLCTVKVFF